MTDSIKDKEKETKGQAMICKTLNAKMRRHDIAEILLKVALSTKSINQSIISLLQIIVYFKIIY
jgi:hypothetical protein